MSWFESLTTPDFSGLPLEELLALDAAAKAYFAPKKTLTVLTEQVLIDESAEPIANELPEPHRLRAIGRIFMPRIESTTNTVTA